MGKPFGLRNACALASALAIVACAQLQGLDGYENVDCAGDGCDDAGSATDGATSSNDASSGGPADTGPTCAPCASGEVCDPKSLKCVECLPGTKDCAAGYFCDPDDAAGYKCVLGCGVVDDCLRAGFVGDGGADAGDAGDGGDAGAGTVACCNNRCVDTSLDGKNCGMCGNSCGVSGACCNSQCLDVVSTPTSCGGCGIVCSNEHITSPTCGARVCNGACDDGWGDCNLDKQLDGCETDIASNVLKCGACNKACSTNHVSTPVCTSGKCTGTCDGTFRDCNGDKQIDGCEVDISTDKLNCGGCDNVCSNSHITTPTCSGGTCNGACDSGYKDCDGKKLINGCETHISGAGADTSNCGDCNIVCSNNNITTPTCNGTCNAACNTGFGDCDNDKTVAGNGCETNLLGDPDHCGSCTNVCSSNHVPTRACSNVGGAGKCTGTCEAGWSDCDTNKLTNGCETNTQTDSQRCGACNVACPAGMRKCVYDSGTGTSSCTTGYGATSSSQAFIDACTQTGTTMPAFTQTNGTDTGDDEGVTDAVTIPFSFSFYSTAYTSLFVASNGWVQLGGTKPTTASFGSMACPLPDTSYTTPTIFAFNADLKGRTTAPTFQLCTATTGAAGSRKFVVTWKNDAFYVSGTTSQGTVTFSLILSETSNDIDVVIQTLSSPDSSQASGATAGIGVESGASATEYACHESILSSGTAVRFLP